MAGVIDDGSQSGGSSHPRLGLKFNRHLELAIRRNSGVGVDCIRGDGGRREAYFRLVNSSVTLVFNHQVREVEFESQLGLPLRQGGGKIDVDILAGSIGQFVGTGGIGLKGVLAMNDKSEVV